MKRIAEQLANRIELASEMYPQFKSPTQMKELKFIRNKYGVVYFVNPKDAMVYAKGKGFKVVDRSAGPDAENGPDESDLEFFFEVTDKSGKTVGLISGEGKEGEAWICPTPQHYAKWEAYQHSQPHHAAVETAAGADEWWDSLADKQQKEYIKLHPNSKYAKKAKSGGGAGLKPARTLTPDQKARKSGQAKKLKGIKAEEKDFEENIPGYADLKRKMAEAQEQIKKFGKLFSEAKKNGDEEDIEDRLLSLEQWEDKADDIDHKIYLLTKKYKGE